MKPKKQENEIIRNGTKMELEPWPNIKYVRETADPDMSANGCLAKKYRENK